MKFALIFIYLWADRTTGFSQEFETKELCEAARQEIMELRELKKVDRSQIVLCKRIRED